VLKKRQSYVIYHHHKPIDLGIFVLSICEVEVALQLMVSQPVCQGVEPTLGLLTRYYFLCECCLKAAVLSLPGSLSDERLSLSFVILSLQQFISIYIKDLSFLCLQFSKVYTKLLSVSARYSRLSSTS
jgi:hypothetical protein